jgi:hypothetical protein
MTRPLLIRALALAIVVAIGVAAAFEAAVALQWVSVGTLPGERARYEGFVMAMGAIATLTGVGLSLVLATRRARATPAVAFGAVAAALMVAHYYTFDTYYLPTLIRYSESGSFSATWVYSVAVAGLLASPLSVVRPPIGLMLTSVVMLLCLFTVVLAGFGH